MQFLQNCALQFQRACTCLITRLASLGFPLTPTYGSAFNPRFLSHKVHIPNIMGFSSVALSWSLWLASVYVHKLTLIMIIFPCLLSPVGTFHQLLHLQKQPGALIFSFWRKGHSVSSILNCVSNRASMDYPQTPTTIDKALSWKSSKMSSQM